MDTFNIKGLLIVLALGCEVVLFAMVKTQKGKEPLIPRNVIDIRGRVHYSESSQSWNTIKLKTEFLNEFKQLKEKRSKFSYELIFSRDKEEVLAKFKEALKDNNTVPILMFLYKDT